MDILKSLSGGDRRSIGKAEIVVGQILKTPVLFGEVVRGFAHSDPVIRMRCADVAEKVSAARPAWLQRHKQAVLALASRAQEKEVRWHVAQMIPRLKLERGERRRAVAWLFKYLADESQIVKTFSMQALFDMSPADAKLRARVVGILRAAIKNGGPAQRNRARKLLKGVGMSAGAARSERAPRWF